MEKCIPHALMWIMGFGDRNAKWVYGQKEMQSGQAYSSKLNIKIYFTLRIQQMSGYTPGN
jgi:hypothetical protein